MVELPQEFCIPVRYDVAKLVRKLRPRSPIRLWLTGYGETGKGSAEALFTDLKYTKSYAWADRALAYHLLGLIDLSPLDRKRAQRILIEVVKMPAERAAWVRRLRYAIVISVLGWTTAFFAMNALFSPPFHTPNWLDLEFALNTVTVPFVFAVLSFRDRNRADTVQRAAASALSKVGDPDCIVTLAPHVRRLPVSAIREEALQTFGAVLPMLTASWYGRMPSGANAALADLLEWFYEDPALDDLALKTLDALEQVGDGASVNSVARIASRTGADRVSERAAAVLPTLLARRERETAAATLLRPSDKNRTDHLVRPVYGNDPDVSNLLRAAHAGSPDTPINKTAS